MTRLRMHSLNCIIPQTLDDFRGDPLHVLAVGFNPQRSPQVARPPHLVETAELLLVACCPPGLSLMHGGLRRSRNTWFRQPHYCFVLALLEMNFTTEGKQPD